MKSCELLVIVVLGGMGSVIGSVISATGLTLLPELLRGFESYRMIVYSLLLVIVMIFAVGPDGHLRLLAWRDNRRILCKNSHSFTEEGGKTKMKPQTKMVPVPSRGIIPSAISTKRRCLKSCVLASTSAA